MTSGTSVLNSRFQVLNSRFHPGAPGQVPNPAPQITQSCKPRGVATEITEITEDTEIITAKAQRTQSNWLPPPLRYNAICFRPRSRAVETRGRPRTI